MMMVGILDSFGQISLLTGQISPCLLIILTNISLPDQYQTYIYLPDQYSDRYLPA